MRKVESLPAPEVLRKLLRYEPETGRLFWRRRSESVSSSKRVAKWFNGRFVGKEAFTATHYKGYKEGKIFCQRYKAHRVIWALVYGEWPPAEIDHINGDPSDNRISNLRAVTSSENCKNSRRYSSNTSGVTGVCWRDDCRKWLAYINIGGGRQIRLGHFADFDAAVRARRRAEAKYGFHENHGREAHAELQS